MLSKSFCAGTIETLRVHKYDQGGFMVFYVDSQKSSSAEEIAFLLNKCILQYRTDTIQNDAGKNKKNNEENNEENNQSTSEKENSEKKNNTSEKKISAEQTDTEQKSDKTEQLPDVKTEKADKTEQIYQQEADERKAQKRVREAVQKENSEAAGKAHESYVIQPGDTLFQISMDRYGSIEAISQICKLNGMSADEIIYPGQVIVLP